MNSKKQKTREHILEKAYVLFAQKGFNAITMKDICIETGLSKGGLYSHFSSTKEIFEAILEKINLKDEMNFDEEIRNEIPAVTILENALKLMKDEMKHKEDSLSLSMYEYAGKAGNDCMNYFTKIGEEKWRTLIEYGIQRGEFNDVDIMEIVNMIFYVYQGLRMWSRIMTITDETIDSIILHIRKQLIKNFETNKKVVLYVHGKGGNALEGEHYRPFFKGYDMVGLDYKTNTPWETKEEITFKVDKLSKKYNQIILIAHSIGAYFSMNALINEKIRKAFFVSPIVNMEKLIMDMMKWANVTEKELEEKKIIHTEFGEDLSWEYLCYVRKHPILWNVPTEILYGEQDHLMSYETMEDFVMKSNAYLTVMKKGEHFFHTDEQMKFLDNWLLQKLDKQ